MKKMLFAILVVLLTVVLWIIFDVSQNGKIVKIEARTEFSRSLNSRADDLLIQLEEGETPDFDLLVDALKYIDGRYDCSDFRIVSLIRILYAHEDKLSEEAKASIKQTLTGFKYWMDQPGEDSMCYWSENHQILFSSAEYLLGNYYKSDEFSNMGILGSQHSEMGKKRVLNWLEQRYLYGYTEWYSSTYYVEDIAPLSVLIDFAPDEEVRNKAKMVLDLLIYDLATQNFKGTFTANSGRMYEAAKMSGEHGSMKESISLIWPDYNRYLKVEKIEGMEVNFKYIKNYDVPEVLVDIGYDQESEQIYRASNGVNLSEYKNEGLLGQEDYQIMFQLASEAFSNPEVIHNTIQYIDKNKMFSNEFLNDFSMINLGILKAFKLTPLVSKILEPMYDGTAIQRANTYMYRTPDYAMSTAQSYHPGMFGDQHSLFSLTINNDLNIFVQHPAASLKEGGALGGSPNYWVGNGYHPHAVQDGNVSINLFVLPEKVNALGDLAGMARNIENYTHAYFPKQYMDQMFIENNYAFGQIGDVYVALIGKNNLAYKSYEDNAFNQEMGLTEAYDLIQEGRETYWITEVGTVAEYGSFDAFTQAIKMNQVGYKDQTVSYKDYDLKFSGAFKKEGQAIDLEYKRFDSKYATAERKADDIRIEYNGKSLNLNFEKNIREVNN